MLARNCIVRLSLTTCLLGGSLGAAEFTPFVNTTDDGLLALANALLGNDPRITVVPGTVHFTGTTTPGTPSTSFAKRVDLGTQGDSFYELSRDGALFTTGTGSPAQTNTSGSFSVTQTPSYTDADLASLVGQPTNDATVLEFDFTVQSEVKSVGFEFMFMSDEFPEYADSVYCDAAAVYVDGTNYAYYNNDPTKYLSVKSSIISGINIFYDNRNSRLPIEYDGVTRPAGILAPLDDTLTTHRLRIAIADTSDKIFDSAILVADVFGSDRVIPANEAGIVPLASPRMPNYTVNTFEGAPPVKIPVRLSQPALEEVTVDYEFNGTPVIDTDYSTSVTTATGTITFAIGEYVKEVTLTALKDDVADGDKTVTFRLTGATKAIPLQGKVVTINLYDVDGGGTGGVGDNGGLSPNPSASELIDGQEQGKDNCGAGGGLAALLSVAGLFAWRRRRT